MKIFFFRKFFIPGKRKKQIGQRPFLSVRSSRSASPTKPTTPLSSLDTRQSKYSPPCRSQSSDGNHTAAAALRARLLCLSLTYALATCPLRAIREGVAHPLRESRCEGSDRRSSRDSPGAP
ncbi:hypothetical protein KY290_000738 [Solanum tuberosum]|uniref:Uncharacterized protein n=1 Tax=Solanum tuberosum TaxID=4113 RepID=A0ABQ7WME0_SOLTU|nr:hypothetical protein KY290_000738 [Solanum tuberosum]